MTNVPNPTSVDKPRGGERPPLGLRPESAAEKARLIEICEAMIRYSEAKRPVPLEWCLELQRRVRGSEWHPA